MNATDASVKTILPNLLLADAELQGRETKRHRSNANEPFVGYRANVLRLRILGRLDEALQRAQSRNGSTCEDAKIVGDVKGRPQSLPCFVLMNAVPYRTEVRLGSSTYYSVLECTARFYGKKRYEYGRITRRRVRYGVWYGWVGYVTQSGAG